MIRNKHIKVFGLSTYHDHIIRDIFWLEREVLGQIERPELLDRKHIRLAQRTYNNHLHSIHSDDNKKECCTAAAQCNDPRAFTPKAV